MGDDQAKKQGDPLIDEGWDDPDEASGPPERPTVAPPFDLASYAKQSMTQPSNAVKPPPSEAPSSDAAASGEVAKKDRPLSLPPPPPLPSRNIRSNVVTKASTAETMPPPAPGASERTPVPLGSERPKPEPADRQRSIRTSPAFPAVAIPTPVPEAPKAFFTPLPPSEEPPSQRITPKEMAAQSAPRPGPPPSAPVAVGPQVGNPSTGNLLALADRRAPLMTPPKVAAVSSVPAEADAPRQTGAPSDPVVEMRERFALGDYSGALVMAESMLDENPTHTEAREYAESCRSVLQQMYTARIGPMHRIPVVEVARDQLRWLSIDHRAGFILSLVDGVSSLEMILDVSGMPPLDALRTLYELVQQRIISIKDE